MSNVVYTEEKITISGIDLYKLEPRDSNPHIGINVYAAKTARIGDEARIGDWARIGNGARIGNEARIGNGASIGNGARIGNEARIGDWARIGDEARIGDWARIGNGASIDKYDFLLIGPIGSRNAYTSIWRHKDGGYFVSCGCFRGTLAEFEARVAEVHGDTQHGKAYKAAIAMARACLNGAEKSPSLPPWRRSVMAKIVVTTKDINCALFEYMQGRHYNALVASAFLAGIWWILKFLGAKRVEMRTKENQPSEHDDLIALSAYMEKRSASATVHDDFLAGRTTSREVS